MCTLPPLFSKVSTHSRLKAAGPIFTLILPILGFNTQPPKGGWLMVVYPFHINNSFNTQPPKGGCDIFHPRLRW